jgi:GT2 family glycosyltransferase
MSDVRHPKIVSIVLNWNGWRDTAGCLRSLARLEGVDHEPLVVDNGSTDGSVERLRGEFPGLQVVETGANLGFGGGVNRGIAAAMARGAEFLWLLNNDATVAPDSLAALVATLQERPDAGFACSKILLADRPDVLWYAGGTCDTPTGFVRHVGQGETDRGQHDHVGDLEFACGCSLLARRRTVEAIGPMPEDYFLYWEDVAWSAMAAAAGWKIAFAPASRVWHAVGASLAPDATSGELLRARYLMRNRILFHRRHRPDRLPRIVLGEVAHTARRTLSRATFRAALADWRGLFDGLCGRTGPIGPTSRR